MTTQNEGTEKKLQKHYSTEGIPPELIQSITFLRQWLNEDRKCTPMVTARDIWHWLDRDFTRAIQTAKMQERERTLQTLEDNRNETLWGDDDSNEIMKESIDAFIKAVKSDIETPITQQ